MEIEGDESTDLIAPPKLFADVEFEVKLQSDISGDERFKYTAPAPFEAVFWLPENTVLRIDPLESDKYIAPP